MTLQQHCSAALLAFSALAARADALPDDPLAGSWRADLAASRFAAGIPRMRSMTMTCVPRLGQRIACDAERVGTNGERETGHFAAGYDGHRYPVTGVRGSRFVTLRRDGPDVIATFGRGDTPTFAYRMVRSKDRLHLTVRSIHPRTGEPLFTTVQYDLVR